MHLSSTFDILGEVLSLQSELLGKLKTAVHADQPVLKDALLNNTCELCMFVSVH